MAEEEQGWGGDYLGPEDMAIPEIKLVQNVGGDFAKASGAEPGDFYCSLTGEVIKGAEGFDLVVVSMQKNRTFWGRAEITDDPPECASMNVVRGGGVSIRGDLCQECERRDDAPWLLTSAERRTKCLINYNILGLDGGSMPVLLRLTGISAQAAKELYTQLTLNRELKGIWFKAQAHVTSIKKKTSAGDAYAVHFGKLSLIEDDDKLKLFGESSQRLLGTVIELPNQPEEVIAETPELKKLVATTSEAKKPKSSEEKPKEKPSEKPEPAETNLDMDF